MRVPIDESHHEEILATLAHFRARMRQDAWRRGRRYALLALPLVCALTLTVFGVIGQPITWAIFSIIALSLAICALPVVRARRTLRSDDELATYLESKLPALRTDLRSSLQLVRQAPASEEAASLRQHLLSRVARALQRELATDAGVARALPARDPKRERLLGGAGLALALLIALVIPSFKKPFQAVAPTDDLVRAELIVSLRNARVVPPSYTGLPARDIPSPTGTLEVFEGSNVELQGEIFVPFDEAWVELGEGEDVQRLPLDVNPYSAFTLQFTPTAHTTLKFRFRRGKEQLQDSRGLSVRVVADQEPRVEILSPQEPVESDGLAIVEIGYEVHDDFGVQQTELVWWFVGSEQDVGRQPLLGPSGAYAEDVAPFDPAPLYMQPGDQVMVHIEARDNRILNGAQTVLSAPVLVMISEEARPEEELLQLKEQASELLLDQLGAQLGIQLTRVESDGSGGIRDVVIEDRTPAQNAELVGAMRESLGGWPAIFDVLGAYLELAGTVDTLDPKHLRTIQSLKDTLFEREREARRMLERVEIELGSGALSGARTAPLARFHASHIRESERAVLALRDLISEHQAEDVARSLAELNTIKDRIRDLLEQYRETRDENLRARIERELDRLSQRMNELLEKLAAQVDKLPDEHFNAEGMEQSEAAENVEQMSDSMKEIRDRLNAGDIDGALSALDQLQNALDAMNEEFGDPFQNADDETLSEFDQAMSEVMEEATALEHAQTELERETAELQREMNEERQQALRQELEQQLERALNDVRQAAEHTREGQEGSEQADVREALDGAAENLESLRRRLENQDIANAEDAALDAQQALQRAASAAERARALTQDPNAQRALREVQQNATQDARNMRAIGERMSELQRQLQPDPNAGQQAQLQQLSQSQQGLQQRAQQLQQRLGELGEQFPMMGEGASEPLQGAEQQMGEASRQLSQRQSGSAQSSQGQAVESLRTMRQQLQQQMARQRAAQQQRQRGRGRTQNRDVEIPQEQTRDLRQREQILDAMREGSLEQWQDPIRQYYESLVR